VGAIAYNPAMARARVEFTVEPFADGAPGDHVHAALDAVRARGLEPEVGPFGSTVEIASNQAAAMVRAVVDAALRHGASRVSVTVALADDDAADRGAGAGG
jgi:uncharacterized protein YqgV (UPF0045/DUF77 family)